MNRSALKELRSQPGYKLLVSLLLEQAQLAAQQELSLDLEGPAALLKLAELRGARRAWERASRLLDDQLFEEKTPS